MESGPVCTETELAFFFSGAGAKILGRHRLRIQLQQKDKQIWKICLKLSNPYKNFFQIFFFSLNCFISLGSAKLSACFDSYEYWKNMLTGLFYTASRNRSRKTDWLIDSGQVRCPRSMYCIRYCIGCPFSPLPRDFYSNHAATASTFKTWLVTSWSANRSQSCLTL